MVSGIGGAYRGGQDLPRAIEDLGQLLRQSQAEAMKTAEKLLRAGIEQAVRDASVGARVDLTA